MMCTVHYCTLYSVLYSNVECTVHVQYSTDTVSEFNLKARCLKDDVTVVVGFDVVEADEPLKISVAVERAAHLVDGVETCDVPRRVRRVQQVLLCHRYNDNRIELNREAPNSFEQHDYSYSY